MTSRTSWTISGSSAEVGSSNRMIGCLVHSARAMANAPLLAAGEVLGKLAGLVRQADALERDHGGLSRLLLGLLLQLDGCEREVAQHRHMG